MQILKYGTRNRMGHARISQSAWLQSVASSGLARWVFVNPHNIRSYHSRTIYRSVWLNYGDTLSSTITTWFSKCYIKPINSICPFPCIRDFSACVLCRMFEIRNVRCEGKKYEFRCGNEVGLCDELLFSHEYKIGKNEVLEDHL